MLRMTEEEFAKKQKAGKVKIITFDDGRPETHLARESKYKNKKTEYNGFEYDSKKEANRAAELDLMVKAGVISHLERQVSYVFSHHGVKICTYKCDFQYARDGRTVVEDVKSDYTRKMPLYRIKRKLMKAFYDIDIIEV